MTTWLPGIGKGVAGALTLSLSVRILTEKSLEDSQDFAKEMDFSLVKEDKEAETSLRTGPSLPGSLT